MLPEDLLKFGMIPEFIGRLPVIVTLLIYLIARGRGMAERGAAEASQVQKAQEAYTVANARLGIGASDRSWMLELWADNLTDEEYIQVGFDAPLQADAWNAFLGAPRTYGVTLRVRY